jgi:PAS domain S-box-containing protein
MANMNTSVSENHIEKICKTLFLSAAEGLVVVDKKGIIQINNPRLEELFGYQSNELIGKPIEILIPKAFHHQHVAQRDGFIKTPQKRPMGIGLSLKAARKDGSEFPVEVSLNHLEVEDETMVMALITDITNRKKIEDEIIQLNNQLEEKVKERTKELEDSQILYSLIARNFPEGTINVFDKNLNYVFVEGQELYKIGITSKNLVGTNYIERLAPEIRDSIKNKLLNVFDGHDSQFVIEHKHQFYKLNAVGLKNEEGNVKQILVVEQNITKQKISEENMQKALQKERELNELKSRFVSMASHEFRTPLSTVLSSASLLEKYIDFSENEDKKMKHLSRIRSSVHNLTAILNDFLSLDKLETGKTNLNLSTFNLKELIEETIDQLAEMKKPNQQIIFDYKGKENIILDKQNIKNILINLISNAIKYSNENQNIHVHCSINDSAILIDVIDHGIGIPESEQKHLFERFFRAENVTNIQGTGLGLNIVKKYIELMEGNITFKSKLNEGTHFSITLPHKQAIQ